MGRSVTEIAKAMLHIQLTQDAVSKGKLQTEVLDSTSFFVVAAADTTEEEWNCGKFELYINEKGQIILFLSGEEATRYAIKHGVVLCDRPMVMKVPKVKVADMIKESCKAKSTGEAKIYSIPPISLVCKVSDFEIEGRRAPNDSSPGEERASGGFLGLDELKEALNTFDRAERRKLDPALRCENIHQVYFDLISVNRIDPDKVDRELDFQVGFTRRFCTDIASIETSKEAMKKLLDYFGLGSYLYIYKDYCKELMEELKQNPVIDKYTLKPARVTTKESFELEEMCRGRDELNGAFVYGLTLKSEHRRIRMVTSSPFGCVIGRNYDVVGLTPISDQNRLKNETETQPDLSDTLREEILKNTAQKQPKLILPSKPGVKLKGTPEEIQIRQNYLIGYFKRRDGINLQAAEKKYEVLAEDPDVLEAFYLYIKDKQWGCLARHGYTPKRLIQELHYPPYEAYCIMIQLQTDTDRAITMLKHRVNEPQYKAGADIEMK